jgi:hypothetical protein
MIHFDTLHIDLDSAVLKSIQDALHHFDHETGPLQVLSEGVRKKGNRLYVPIRPERHPPTMFSFLYAIAGAEVELRDAGLDVQLTPEYAQPYVVVAQIRGDPKRYIYFSQEGQEYDDLAKLLGREVKWSKETVMIEGYPFDGPEDRDKALQEALTEYPNSTVLN